ncbi:hypothetical protein D3C73_1628460 [compost metagenome]
MLVSMASDLVAGSFDLGDNILMRFAPGGRQEEGSFGHLFVFKHLQDRPGPLLPPADVKG